MFNSSRQLNCKLPVKQRSYDFILHQAIIKFPLLSLLIIIIIIIIVFVVVIVTSCYQFNNFLFYINFETACVSGIAVFEK